MRRDGLGNEAREPLEDRIHPQGAHPVQDLMFQGNLRVKPGL